MPRRVAGRLEQLLAAREILVVCGAGGVGKTTTAAALGAGAAMRTSARVLVLTVDPARRLADALGVALDNEPRRVPAAAFGSARPRGELWAAMLDTRRSWDALVRRHAPSPSAAEEILANPLYVNLTQRFALSHEYIAMERLYELQREGAYDLLVVDTPPSQNALDFLDAPERMAEFFSSHLLRWLIAPRRTRLLDLASRPFYQVADRLLGTQLLEDVSRFFLLFNSMHEGFVERARSVGALVRSSRTAFAVVSTLEATPVAEARELAAELERRRLQVGFIVANKVLPQSFTDAGLGRLAEELRRNADHLAATITEESGSRLSAATELARVLAEVGGSFENYRLVAQRENELALELAGAHELVVRVPHLAGAATELSGVLAIGAELFAGS